MTKIWGIDVSKYNYPINWQKVKNAGVKFVILRVSSYSNMRNPNSIYKDPYFETFYKGAKKVGLPVGAYFYSQCENSTQAKKEANFVLDCLEGKQFEYPIYIDVENQHTLKNTTSTQLTSAVVTALETIEKEGYYVGIYSGKYTLRDEMNAGKLKAYDKWIAQYAKSCTYTGAYNMWQFGAEWNYLTKKKIAGIGSDVADQNYCYVDYPKVIKKFGLNGFKKLDPNYVSGKLPFYIETITAVNIREEADIKAKVIYTPSAQMRYEVSRVSSNGKWGYVNYRKGWISLSKKYVKRIKSL